MRNFSSKIFENIFALAVDKRPNVVRVAARFWEKKTPPLPCATVPMNFVHSGRAGLLSTTS
jgi:hypothetical protein